MDVLIAGAGVSALLLAQSLVRRKCIGRLRIVGQRRPLRAHRLSYWSDVSTPFDPYTDASWSAVRVVGADGQSAETTLSRFRYRSMDTARWFGELEREVLDAPGVELIDTHIVDIGSANTHAWVRTSADRYEADWVFSSIAVGTERPDAWQRFEGWEIGVDEGSVDDHVATLLDFRTPAKDDFRFVYTLPLAPARLFVEHVSYADCRHADHLTAYLENVLGLRSWTVLDREHGATPAYPHGRRRIEGRVVHIGVTGGLAKTATGYALLRMWRDAETIAEGVDRRGIPVLPKASRGLYRLADGYFLYLLRQDPERLPVLLASLFDGATGDAVLAFLDERASLRERVEVSRAVPGWMSWWAGHGDLPARDEVGHGRP